MASNEKNFASAEVERAVKLAKKIQQEVLQVDSAHAEEDEKKAEATQAGASRQPAPPMPAQQLTKPGHEADMQLAPRFECRDYKGSGKLQDMVAIVTGGDSGIGRAVAVLYAREGANVVIVYLDEHEDAEETKRHVEKEGRQCVIISGDVKDSSFCNFAVNRTIDEFGKLDILVNNAAFQEHAASLEDLTEEHFDLTLRTNVYGYFHMAKAALPHLREGSCIINTGSETGLFGSKELIDYSATKGAIHAFTKALASNLMPRGIRVNAVAPGPVWTPLNPADRKAEDVAKFGATTEMKRPAQPEELSPAYVFLASPVCSSYISGLILPVIGGASGS
ncbi:MAG TPA: SDR family oxidoreductase [Methylobacter sp.]|jgi:NAD(P)-dependent dehydrogenase (short-subunit alcohol dehydrogenase family)